MTHPPIYRVTTLDLSFKPRPWQFAQARRAEIDAHFVLAQREKPSLWNGRVLLGRNPAFTRGRFSADYFEADFASFLAWRDWGFPDRDVFNGFGMGALRCADGACLLGEMGHHTANAGRVYFPSGTPDLGDIKGYAFGFPGDAGIARCAPEFRHQCGARDFPRQRVFAAAGTEQKNVHEENQ